MDPDTGTTIPPSQNGSADAIVWKLDLADGKTKFVRSFAGPGQDRGNRVAIDGTGRAHVCGEFTDSIDFGKGVIQSAGVLDGFLASIAPDGTIDPITFGGPKGDSCRGIAVESPRAVWIGGFYNDSMTLGSLSLTSNGKADGFVARVVR
jgi:hypothetical protein